MFLRHPVLSVATFAYLAIVGWLTLTPQSGNRQDSLLWRIALFFDAHASTEWITFNVLEFAANVAMFVPIGLFFVLLLGRRQWWLAVVLAVVLTLGIEFAQRFIPNRVSDPRDIMSNSAGAIVGVLAALLLTAGKARRIRLAARQLAATR
ncbi:MAG: VanZ family protein [Rhodoglobus sp.]|nr:VanZ family protein [Rhodoglobus sp.]